MLRATRPIGALALALALIGTGCAAFPQPRTENLNDIVGTYYVNGVDPQEVEYGGRLEIIPGEEPDEYAMQWIVTGSIQVGTGVRDGDRIEFDWATVAGSTPEERPSAGTGEYTIEEDGTLRGTRTVDGIAEIGTEEAFPVAE